MKERIVEILVYLMSEMQENKQLSDIDLGALRTQGYTQSEISDAFAWLYDMFHEGGPSPGRPAEPSRGSRRVLHEAERLMFSTESQGYLILLAELGLLDDRDFEIVIERAMVGGYERLSVAEVRQLVASVLSGKRRWGHSAGSLLPGGDDLIH
jgi:uncharacterized protein Smg (DUF494 family)